MGESRTELLAWVNDLLQLNYTKVEQCGTGGAYCQILDSIYGDVPMSRVKMNAKHEYEFLVNYKVMQTFFKNKKIDKPIPVDKLVKCKMQDNLEFLQWIKRFWDQNFPGGDYDPVSRRKGAPTETPATIAPLGSGRAPTGGLGAGAARAGGRTPIGGPRAASAASNERITQLQGELKEMSTHLEGLEKERDFYFNKLRDIEILVTAQVEENEKQGNPDVLLNEIQKILYSTEDGFEVPDPASAGAADDEETF